jgi:hypothetical protein
MMRSVNLAVAALLAIGAAGACTRNDRAAADRTADRTADAMTPSPSPTTGAYGSSMSDKGPSAGDIADHPAQYAGQRVTLKSDVKKVMPNGFFVLDDHDTLVMSASGSPIEKQEVTVHGTVHTYSAPELKTKFAWFKSNRELEAQYNNRAVIVADSIVTADGRELLSGAALPAGSGEPDTSTTGRPRPVDRP